MPTILRLVPFAKFLVCIAVFGCGSEQSNLEATSAGARATRAVDFAEQATERALRPNATPDDLARALEAVAVAERANEEFGALQIGVHLDRPPSSGKFSSQEPSSSSWTTEHEMRYLALESLAAEGGLNSDDRRRFEAIGQHRRAALSSLDDEGSAMLLSAKAKYQTDHSALVDPTSGYSGPMKPGMAKQMAQDIVARKQMRQDALSGLDDLENSLGGSPRADSSPTDPARDPVFRAVAESRGIDLTALDAAAARHDVALRRMNDAEAATEAAMRSGNSAIRDANLSEYRLAVENYKTVKAGYRLEIVRILNQ